MSRTQRIGLLVAAAVTTTTTQTTDQGESGTTETETTSTGTTEPAPESIRVDIRGACRASSCSVNPSITPSIQYWDRTAWRASLYWQSGGIGVEHVMLPIAHAGHWLTGIAYFLPVICFLVWLGITQLKERRRRQ